MTQTIQAGQIDRRRIQTTHMAIARPRNWFFAGLALVMVATVAFGFGPTLYLRSVLGVTDRFGASLPPYLVVHGIVLTAWYVLFAAQTLLVTAGRRDIHRRLGVAGTVLAVAVVASSGVTVQRLASRAIAAGPDLTSRAVPIVVSDFWVLVAFTLLVGAAIYLRRRLGTHKRLMLLASVLLVGPALATGRPIGRTVVTYLPAWLLPSQVFIALCLGALVWHDIATSRRVEPATLWGGVAVVAVLAITRLMAFGGSGAVFARWFAGLAG
jgi:hypothetical protein